jgi:hypothetical protein
VTSLSATPGAKGHWVFTSDGRGVPFGDAAFFGDMSAARLSTDRSSTPSRRRPVLAYSWWPVTAGSSPSGRAASYWLVAADGRVFAFQAPLKGSMGATHLNRAVTGMVRFQEGYLMVGEDRGVFNFSSQAFYGSLGANPPNRPIVSVAVLDR